MLFRVLVLSSSLNCSQNEEGGKQKQIRYEVPFCRVNFLHKTPRQRNACHLESKGSSAIASFCYSRIDGGWIPCKVEPGIVGG